MGVRIDIEINGLDAILGALRRVENADLRPLFEEIGGYLDSRTEDRFDKAVDPYGNPWHPSKRALREGDKTLTDHHNLRDSFTHNVFGDGSGVEHGTNDERAGTLHFGAKKGAFGRGSYKTRRGSFSIPWGDIKPRPMIDVTDDDREEILDIVTQFYSKVFPR